MVKIGKEEWGPYIRFSGFMRVTGSSSSSSTWSASSRVIAPLRNIRGPEAMKSGFVVKPLGISKWLTCYPSQLTLFLKY